jgi:mannosidase alpha-like ER degradation enhancer 2
MALLVCLLIVVVVLAAELVDADRGRRHQHTDHVADHVADDDSVGWSTARRRAMRERVRGMFHHAFDHYMQLAFPADELKPVSCEARDRTKEPRGSLDDALGDFALTLVDAMDTLFVMGEVAHFESAVQAVLQHVTFDRDVTVSVFETTIRVLGGLLSAHVFVSELAPPWYDGGLLRLAADLGERLLPAFATATGIPFHRVNLLHGVPRGETTLANTAGAGTLTLEFGLLSRLTGDERFDAAANGAVAALYARRSPIDLIGAMIDVHTGQWTDRAASIGAGGDSFYEYLLKSYVLFGDERALLMFNRTYEAVELYLRTEQAWYFEVDMSSGNVVRRHTDSLGAFWPGLQSLIGDIAAAEAVQSNYLNVWRHFGFLPEGMLAGDEHGARQSVRFGSYLLRPELLESTYFLYRATRHERHLDALEMMADSIELTRTRCGFACVADVTENTLRLEDRLDSFFLSETLKYLFLAFDDDNPLHKRAVVFTTEGHPFPVSWARQTSGAAQPSPPPSSPPQRSVAEKIIDSLLSKAPVTSGLFERQRLQARELVQRDQLAIAKTLRTQTTPSRCARFNRAAADAEQFRERTAALFRRQCLRRFKEPTRQRLSSTTITSVAATPAPAAPTAVLKLAMYVFHQRPLALAENVVLLQQLRPGGVTPMSPVLSAVVGDTRILAAPALFGPFLNNSGVCGELAWADPRTGCEPIVNSVAGKIAVLNRGNCFFIEKAAHAQAAGAIGALVVEDHLQHMTTFDAMIAGGDTDAQTITIPSLLVAEAAFRTVRERVDRGADACLRRLMPVDSEPLAQLRVEHAFKVEETSEPNFVTVALVNDNGDAVPLNDNLLAMIKLQLQANWRVQLEPVVDER